MVRLGVNIDHVATVRQARGGREPEPVAAAVLAELGGADQITVHLREDRRHILDRDVRLLRETIATPLNLEMSLAPDIVDIALEVGPDRATLVPERREELTTEGGLDVASRVLPVRQTIERLRSRGISVSLFIDPELSQIEAAGEAGADAVELHTGSYANAVRDEEASSRELHLLERAAARAAELGLSVAAGHGLDYRNAEPVAAIATIEELNIGHSIVSRAVLVGMTRAVNEMKYLLLRVRPILDGGAATRGKDSTGPHSDAGPRR